MMMMIFHHHHHHLSSTSLIFFFHHVCTADFYSAENQIQDKIHEHDENMVYNNNNDK